jgi:hypothetical protein
VDERVERARQHYERAVFSGDADALTEADRELDEVEAELAEASGAHRILRSVSQARAEL